MWLMRVLTFSVSSAWTTRPGEKRRQTAAGPLSIQGHAPAAAGAAAEVYPHQAGQVQRRAVQHQPSAAEGPADLPRPEAAAKGPNVLIMGCGHCGVVNILEKAAPYRPELCVGGFHLWSPSSRRRSAPPAVRSHPRRRRPPPGRSCSPGYGTPPLF